MPDERISTITIPPYRKIESFDGPLCSPACPFCASDDQDSWCSLKANISLLDCCEDYEKTPGPTCPGPGRYHLVREEEAPVINSRKIGDMFYAYCSGGESISDEEVKSAALLADVGEKGLVAVGPCPTEEAAALWLSEFLLEMAKRRYEEEEAKL